MPTGVVSGSLVLYNNSPNQFGAVIESFLNSPQSGNIIVVDNSEVLTRHPLLDHPRVKYLFLGSNVGFGAAHNVAIQRLGDSSELHLILNPDVVFSPAVISTLARVFSTDPQVGAAMPRVNYPDHTLQRLCKLLPDPSTLIFRRFIPMPWLRTRLNRFYELHGLSQTRPSEVPTISGCFLLMRTRLLMDLGGFDERFFMYMEDVDLVRRVGDTHKVVYVPHASIQHGYAKGSYRDGKLMWHHVRSAIRYFNKWGWWCDPTRRHRNAKALSTLCYLEDSDE